MTGFAPKYDLFVFDWDGTLADTIPTLKSAYDATFAVLGLPPMTYDQIKEAAGKYSNRNIFQNVHIWHKQKLPVPKRYRQSVCKFDAVLLLTYQLR